MKLTRWATALCIAILLVSVSPRTPLSAAAAVTSITGPAACPSAAEVEPNDTPMQACSITPYLGQPVSGAISPAGDTDYYAFTATAGSKVFAYVDTGGTSTGASRNVTMALLDQDGSTVLQSDSGSGTGTGGTATTSAGSASIAGRSLPGSGSGVYYIRVTATSGTDTVIPYNLYVSVPNPASRMTNNGAGNGQGLYTAPQIATGDNYLYGYSCCNNYGAPNGNFYAIYAAAGSRLFLSLDGSPSRSSGAGLGLALYDTNGAQILLAEQGAGASIPSEAFDYVVPNTGMYYVNVYEPYPYSGGAYSLWVHDQQSNVGPPALGPTCFSETEPNNSVSTATPVSLSHFGCGIQGSISPVGDVDYYSFPVQARDHIYALVDSGGPESGTSTDTALTLYNPASTAIASDDNDGLGNNGGGIENFKSSAISDVVASSAGTYYLAVSEAAGTGTIVPYRLFIYSVPVSNQVANQEPDDNVATANGSPFQTTEFYSTSSDQNDFYSLSAQAGQPIWISTTAGPTLTLYSSNGTTMLLKDFRAGSLGFNFTAPGSATYYVQAQCYCAYHLLISTPGSNPTGVPLAVPSRLSVSPRITSAGKHTTISLSGHPGAVCQIAVVYPRAVHATSIAALRGMKVVSQSRMVRWSWTPGAVTTGQGRALASCWWQGQKGSLSATFTIR